MHAHPRVLLAPLVAAILVALTLSVAAPAQAVVSYSDPADKIIELTNKERAANGVSYVKRSRALDAVAQAWAEELAAIYERALLKDPYAGVPLSHNPNTSKQIPSNWYAWGENVAWNRGYNDPVAKMNDQWIKSPSHHENMVKSRFNYMGAGWYTDKFGVSWGVQVFGQYIGTNPDSSYEAPLASVAPAPEPMDTVSLRRGTTFLIKNNLGEGLPHDSIRHGYSTDEILVGDWDGDGDDDLGVKRGRTYYLWNSINTRSVWKKFTLGYSSDDAIVGDFNGDGKDTIGLKRGNKYYVSNKLGGGSWVYYAKSMGYSSDEPVIGDFNGDGKDTIGLKRGNKYYLKNTLLRGGWPIYGVKMGLSSDDAIVGDFNGDGRDTVGLKRGNKYYIKDGLIYGKWSLYSEVIGKSTDDAVIGDFDA
ncbi:CAP domain-containing protein [Demequina zhanjiangensis]|uniref:CAP domain-containing protein n=1 Tax=Demequina zhanjiangensis TaxID=3051659 RepID=A0ABT8FYT8_9MICO|nr:CAP domain-containing protein [Demequina sp. SYSU T00b26]MDN4472007.1 CAP domain-containing protein [Demequina sp. SYSU T00b26]